MSEPYVIKMPQLSDTMTEGVIVSWEKNIGDEISRGDIVATVETDKAVMDVEVFRDGWNWTVLGLPVAMLIGVVLVAAGLLDDHRQRRDVQDVHVRFDDGVDLAGGQAVVVIIVAVSPRAVGARHDAPE